MSYLNIQIKDLKSREAFYTAKEICTQPALWKETWSKLLGEKNTVLKFLSKFMEEDNPCVILTGAGTSAFIGEVLEGPLQKKWGIPSRAIATTDIVTHPENYFSRTRPTLLISFARSGDSPESLQTVRLAKKHCDKLFELNITCNPQGELAKNTTGENSCLFLLPEETNDRSLAMTSSFSSMLLTGLLIVDIYKIAELKPFISRVCDMGQYILDEFLPGLKKIAEMDFERMVFLGSGSLFGVAHESHLKVQELSNGKIICKYDSFLGFRHGPKAVVNNSTIMVYLLAGNDYVNLYELDLIRSVKATAAGEKLVAVGNNYNEKEFQFDLAVKFPGRTDGIPEEFLAVPYILPAQILGFFKSLHLGLSPDSPSSNGSISRVVQGVKIYPENESNKH
jgi:tagatose-6-phosphate ketose/aldose isomerase